MWVRLLDITLTKKCHGSVHLAIQLDLTNLINIHKQIDGVIAGFAKTKISTRWCQKTKVSEVLSYLKEYPTNKEHVSTKQSLWILNIVFIRHTFLLLHNGYASVCTMVSFLTLITWSKCTANLQTKILFCCNIPTYFETSV